MNIVLGVSMVPTTVRMVLVEGENADGVTVDADDFDLDGADGGPNRVVSAILGTRESAAEGGYQLTSTGVTFSDQADAAVLRDALADHKIENVMLVSAFLAAAALAQAVGGAVGYSRTALMFVEPDTATLAVVDSADGSIAGVRRQRIVSGDGVAELTELVAGLDGVELRPDGVFVVGSGVEIASIKPRLEAATSLPVSAPEEPEMALARGAALASAHAPLFASSTQAVAYAQDPETGEVDLDALALGYAYVPPAAVDHDATHDVNGLAYSAVPDEPDPPYIAAPFEDDGGRLDSGLLDFRVDETEQARRPPLLVTGVSALFVVGVLALVIALAFGMRPTASQRPSPAGHVVVPTQQAAPPAAPKAPAPAPAKAPAPAPVPVHVPAPAPPPAAPPAPAPPPALPPIQIPIPVLPGFGGESPPVQGPPSHGGQGHGDDHGNDDLPQIPIFGGGHDGHGLIPKIPGIPGL